MQKRKEGEGGKQQKEVLLSRRISCRERERERERVRERERDREIERSREREREIQRYSDTEIQ